MTESKYTLGFRRKRKGLTDYRKRLRILTAKKPRCVIRKSLKNIQASIIEFDAKGDKVKVSSHSAQIKKLGWKFNTANTPAAYLVGYLLGKKATKAGITEAVLDTGLQKVIKQGKLFAVVAGAVDAGLKIPHGEGVLPAKERLNGSHITKEADISKIVDDVKAAIDKQ